MSPRFPRFGSVLVRSFAIQASWNYERMVGTGFGWVCLPALRALAGEDPARLAVLLARHSRFFNAHPYFAGLAVGAVLRAEHDGAPAERIDRLRDALCGPLGSIGDALFWAAWLPASAAIGITLAALGAGWWGAVAFLVVYNAAHGVARVWGLRAGWERGLQVATALSAPGLRSTLAWARPAAAFLFGLSLPLALAWQMRGGDARLWVAAVVAALGFALTLRLMRRVSGVALAALAFVVIGAAGLLWW